LLKGLLYPTKNKIVYFLKLRIKIYFLKIKFFKIIILFIFF
jgi:hypothetical protein